MSNERRPPDFSLHFRTTEQGGVEMWTTPEITQEMAALHIAQIKAGQPGYGPAFNYLVACLGTAQRRSSGIGKVEEQEVRSSLIWTPDSMKS
jgi:hypothetical protein